MPSSVIANITYFPETQTLRITFVSGMIYDYLDVPEMIYTAFKTSDAKGIYLNRNIKGKYKFVKAH